MFSMFRKILSRSVCKNNASGTGAFFQGRSGKRWLNGGWEPLEPREYLAVDLISGPSIFPTNLANRESTSPSISADGRYVAFVSKASNLDNNNYGVFQNVFVKDTQTGNVSRISTDLSGISNYGNSYAPNISADGRYVTFVSDSPYLVNGDTNRKADIFVKDMQTGVVTRASTSSTGVEALAGSTTPSISANGRYLAFVSFASNLVSGDTNGKPDIFVKDMQNGTIKRVSTTSNGVQVSSSSSAPSLSADGRSVAFVSFSSNLVPGDTNGKADVFVKDIDTGAIIRVSTRSTGSQANNASDSPSMSANGRYIAFKSSATNLVNGDTNGVADIFVKDTDTGTITRINANASGQQANFGSYIPSISANGRYIAFRSLASNLIAGDTNRQADIFVKDTVTGLVTRSSASSEGTAANKNSLAPSISGNGQFVAFSSVADNLVNRDINAVSDIFVKEISSGTLTNASTRQFESNRALDGSYDPSISANGRFVAFESIASNLVLNDANNAYDIFVKDVISGSRTLVSGRSDGQSANGHSSNPSISANGRFVAFDSDATNLVTGDTNNTRDIFVKDTETGTIKRVNTNNTGLQANGFSYSPQISANGRYVTFSSSASNLAGNDTNNNYDVFIKDTISGTIKRVSISNSGAQGNSGSFRSQVSDDGKYVLFESYASNLVSGDTNNLADLFWKDLVTGSIKRVNTSKLGIQANDNFFELGMNATGRYVVFSSDASNLVNGDTNNEYDIFRKDTLTGNIERISTPELGGEAENGSYRASISANGRYVAFESYSSNLVPGDLNFNSDIFLKDTETGLLIRLNINDEGLSINSLSLSANGQYVAFGSDSSYLVGGDDNRAEDIFRASNPLITNPAPVAAPVALPSLPLVELPEMTTPVANEKEDNIPLTPDMTAVVPINPDEVDRYFTREE